MIKTKIAQILSPTRVVLAAGTEQGVREGMEFIIYELSDDIYDPETKEPLGQLELQKGRVKVILTQEKMSTAMTLPKKVYYPSFVEALGSTAFASQGRWREEYEKLLVEQGVALAEENELTVRVGDLVRSVS